MTNNEKLKNKLEFYKRIFTNRYRTWFEIVVILQTLCDEGQMEIKTFNRLNDLMQEIKRHCEGIEE